jgi:hypothetical protein
VRRRYDPELGWVKSCSGCHEEWPVDEDFYWFQARTRADGTVVKQPNPRCKACWLERYRRTA